MKRVICSIPNAGEEIDGIKFHQLDDGRVISDEISDEEADRYASIPGYEIDSANTPAPSSAEPAKSAPRLTKAQQKKLDDEKAAADKAEADRVAAEEADRIAAEQAEIDRVAAEEAAAAELAEKGNTNQDEVF